MKLRLIAVLCSVPLFAAEPKSFTYWSASELQGMSQKLVSKMNGAKFASQQLERYGNHYTMVAHREGNGEAEMHMVDADLFVVQTGSATLVVGGKIHNPKTSAPNEVRGPSIDGGARQTLAPGDIVHIPAKTPHQLQIQAGKEFTYFTLKVSGQ